MGHILLFLTAKPSAAGIDLIATRLGVVAGQIIICGDKDSKEGLAVSA